MSLREIKTIKERRKFIMKKTGQNLEAIGIYPGKLEEAQWRNCENMIGCVQIPLGIAGPLKLEGNYAKGEYYIPLATTEGALVASVNRGCKAITLSGGANVISENVGITRGSVFNTQNLKEGWQLKTWLEENLRKLAKEAEETSSHLSLTNIWTNILGRNVFVRFSFDTTDAMGMNMVTIAAEKISQLIEKETGSACLSLAGNFDIDKKPAWLNFILGRGRKVWAEAILDKKIVSGVLKTTPEKIHEVAVKKCLLGSALSGSLGFNAHFANIIAAIFIACGQDPAHTVEGSLGITSTEIIDEGLYISVYLPDLVVGTVGGGTLLPSQKEALSILGVLDGVKGVKTDRFVQIIGGAVLSGELSLLASLAQGTLASSHQKLARRNKLPK